MIQTVKRKFFLNNFELEKTPKKISKKVTQIKGKGTKMLLIPSIHKKSEKMALLRRGVGYQTVNNGILNADTCIFVSRLHIIHTDFAHLVCRLVTSILQTCHIDILPADLSHPTCKLFITHLQTSHILPADR